MIVNRRHALSAFANGFGMLGLAGLLAEQAKGESASPLGVKAPHFPAKAKRVIFLFMSGGPSHIDTFDPKPKVRELDRKPLPFEQPKLVRTRTGNLLASPFKFAKHGASGVEVSELFPNVAKHIDDICVVRSMYADNINHNGACLQMNTGEQAFSRPSMGSWLLYGLGAETQDLPGFIVLNSQGKYGLQPISARQWSSGVLPSRFQGIQFQSRGDAVHYVGNPEGVCQSTQRQVIDEVRRMNGLLADETRDPEIATRIAQYELAFKMQSSVPELTDFKNEPQAMIDLYGVKEPGDGSFASNCILARRLAERGVRMIQLYHRAWDHHSDLELGMKAGAKEVDQATAALITDLKQRGMLDDTLILWGGEFGRTPMGQGSGRDHHINAFSVFMAGGGVKAGTVYGSTDELGYRAQENPVNVHDLHATMLALLGVDHHRLNTKFQGLDVRLTGVAGNVVKGIMA